MRHQAKVTDQGEPCSNLDGGRPTHPAIVAIEGHVESLVALSDDVRALEHVLHTTHRVRAILCRLEDETRDRIMRLGQAIPEVQRAYRAAEITYQAVTAA